MLLFNALSDPVKLLVAPRSRRRTRFSTTSTTRDATTMSDRKSLIHTTVREADGEGRLLDGRRRPDTALDDLERTRRMCSFAADLTPALEEPEPPVGIVGGRSPSFSVDTTSRNGIRHWDRLAPLFRPSNLLADSGNSLSG